MKLSTNLRPQALKLASQLVKQTTLSFGAAQKQAWASVKLCAQMHQKPVSFFYRKGDGTERFAVGYYPAAGPTNGNPVTTSALAVRYFDTLANGWRSFRADRLIIC